MWYVCVPLGRTFTQLFHLSSPAHCSTTAFGLIEAISPAPRLHGLHPSSDIDDVQSASGSSRDIANIVVVYLVSGWPDFNDFGSPSPPHTHPQGEEVVSPALLLFPLHILLCPFPSGLAYRLIRPIPIAARNLLQRLNKSSTGALLFQLMPQSQPG